MNEREQAWRQRVAERCGGADFDAPGSGYSFGVVLAEEHELAKANKPGDPTSALLTLSIADPTGKMFWKAIKTAEEYYHNCPNATRYTDNTGVRGDDNLVFGGSTNALLADWLNFRFGGGRNPFTPDWVQYSPGAIKMALSTYLPTLLFEPTTKLFFPTPGYGVVKSPMNACGAQISDVPLVCIYKDKGLWDFDLEEMSRRCQCHHGLRVMYVNMPHNPTGAGYSRGQWINLLEWAGTHNIVLVVDEAYTDLRYNDRTCSILTVDGWEENCIVLQSISKGWSATGVRFGWIVGHPTIIKAVRQVMDVKDSGLFALSIAAGLTCLSESAITEITSREYQLLHRQLQAGLTQAGFKSAMPEAGLCQFTPAPRAINGVEFTTAAECAKWLRQEQRISVMHYDLAKQPWLRWAVTLQPVEQCGLGDEQAIIAEAVRRLTRLKIEF
ncbi:MAG: aminotransferase class I/II-fold pyridoxal phosphate-dependent enzyme [Patescibacteria group bacterium]|jgi:aspartate/methionine/tyrosine aminotransferase|nr:aminotransferase class I/II-fold pyridoxal phosphate-dependent enzyme [Patescibacteria group bacterium]